jgi:Tol biopolymer transport system component
MARNVDTNQLHEIELTIGLQELVPQTWSPSEDYIVLTKLISRTESQVVVVSIDGSDTSALDLPHRYPYSIIGNVSYSPSGRFVAYQETDAFQKPPLTHGIFTTAVYDLAAEDAASLGDTSANCTSPQWSPAEDRVLVICDASDPELTLSPDYHVHVYDVASQARAGLMQLADFPGCSQAAWSFNGEKLVMVCTSGGEKSLFTATADGTDHREIDIGTLTAPNYLSNPLWTPDGNQVIYIAGPSPDSSHIYVVNADGSNNTAITEQPSNYDELSVYRIAP